MISRSAYNLVLSGLLLFVPAAAVMPVLAAPLKGAPKAIAVDCGEVGGPPLDVERDICCPFDGENRFSQPASMGFPLAHLFEDFVDNTTPLETPNRFVRDAKTGKVETRDNDPVIKGRRLAQKYNTELIHQWTGTRCYGKAPPGPRERPDRDGWQLP